VEVGQIANEPSAVRRVVERLARRHGRLEFAYEAGPCGYELYRLLLALGHGCVVAAPSLMPRRPGDHIKTDKRDAATLARLLRRGDLTAVWVPDAHHEAIRELVRCRADFKQVERRGRQQLCALLLRHGRSYAKSNWTQEHGRWLLGQRFDHPQTQLVFEHYLHSIMEAGERLGQLERQMEAALAGWSLAALVRGLMAMRGIKLVAAMTHAAELGDITRFGRAQELMAFVGLVPRESSSGPARRLGRITKSGNGAVRRVLVESSWSYRHKPQLTPALRTRGKDASEAVRAIAWKAQKRLHGRYHRLVNRGKSVQTAITAVAREQLGFIWAIGLQVMQEQHPEQLAPATVGV
jgi:transposase